MEQVRNGNCGLLVNVCRFFKERRNAMKKMMIVMVSVIGLTAGVSFGAIIHSDDFNDGVIDSQWTVEKVDGAHVSESDVAYLLRTKKTYSGDPAGLKSSPGSIPSGDFSMSIEFDMQGYYHGSGSGGENDPHQYFEFKIDDNNYIKAIHHRTSDGKWLQYAEKNINGTKEQSSEQQVAWDMAYKIVRSGNNISVYWADYDVDPSSWHEPNWTLMYGPTSFPTDAGYVRFGVNSCAGSTLETYWDDFIFTPEPATIGLLLLGIVGLIRRR